MKRKVIISILLVCALMSNSMWSIMAADTEVDPVSIEQSEGAPASLSESSSEPSEVTDEFEEESSIPETEENEENESIPEEVIPENEPPTERLLASIPNIPDTTTDSENETESISNDVPVVEVPTLAAGKTWYKGSTARNTFTAINIVDSADEETIANATESWSAADDDSDGVMCYVNGTVLTISGNGSGKIMAKADSHAMFADFWHITVINGLDLLDTSNVRDMSCMFYRLWDLKTLDVSTWDTSNVTNMEETFSGCEALTSLDASNWDTDNVTNMRQMFYGCEALTSLNLGDFNTSNVTNMSGMFYKCSSLTILDVNTWSTSKVTDMSSMFSACNAIISLDLSNWNTSNVTNMSSMFNGCRQLSVVKIENFNTSNVTNMYHMFNYCESLNSLDLSNWNTSRVTNMAGMFSWCTSLTTLNISSFDTKSVTGTSSANGLTAFCRTNYSLKALILGENFGQSYNVPAAGGLNGMFNCSNKNCNVTVSGANDIMKAYDWMTDNCVVTFADIESEVGSGTVSNLGSISTPGSLTNPGSVSTTVPSVSESISSNRQPSSSGGGGGGGGGSATKKVASPIASNSDSEVVKGTKVELSTSTKDAKIYYTVDGSIPTVSSTLYTAPIVLEGPTTIKMFALKDDMDNSAVVTVSYKVRNASIKQKNDVEKIPYMALRQDNKFMPDEAATRYEIITALANLFDIEKTDIVKEFNDVENENAELVSLFSGASIINGYPDGTFGGDKGITRAEFIKILTVMLNLEESTENVADLNDIDNHWGKEYITSFVNKGYIQGYPDRTFQPDNNITRAEAVTIINRIINSSAKDSTVSEDVAETHWAYDDIRNAVIINE